MNINESLNEHCTIIENKSHIDVYYLHGFMGSKELGFPFKDYFGKKGYNIITCDARGHGTRQGSVFDWMGTVNDLNAMINDRRNDAILIGSSMGATEALTIGSINDRVKQVFAISALHDAEPFDDTVRSLTRDEISNFTDAFPMHYGKCNKENKQKFFLIHSEDDQIVTMKQFKKNKDLFCLDAKNVFIYPKLEIDLMAHATTTYRLETLNFIDANIIKPKNPSLLT